MSVQRAGVIGEAPESDSEDERQVIGEHVNVQEVLPSDPPGFSVPMPTAVMFGPPLLPRTFITQQFEEHIRKMEVDLVNTTDKFIEQCDRQIRAIEETALDSQKELQQMLKDARKDFADLEATGNNLRNLLQADFVPNINVRVPTSEI